MMLVKYGQAAMIAAILTLTGNAVWAQNSGSQSSPSGQDSINYFLSVSTSCKDGKCCKDGECCSASKKCDAKCSCCKDSKCSCSKGSECACDKNGKCSCDKDKTSTTKAACACCPIMSKLAKRTAIIMVMPASMPMPACCMEAMGMLPHPPMPPGSHVFLPPMMPPMPPIPPTPSMGIGMPIAMPPMPAGYAPCPYGATVCADRPDCVVSCCPATPTMATKVCISPVPSSDQLEMCVGEGTCIRCKKMTIKIGENEIAVSRFDNRVRIRGAELKTTADCVRTDGKDNLILEGNVVLHYKKEGNSDYCVMKAEHIEMNLNSGAVSVKSIGKLSNGITPVLHESK